MMSPYFEFISDPSNWLRRRLQQTIEGLFWYRVLYSRILDCVAISDVVFGKIGHQVLLGELF